jgi:predicted nucleotidyltransferase
MRIDPEVLAELCERHDIGRLRLFGSAARGEASEGSDVDLIADFTRRKGLLDLVRIEREFSARLGRKVDLLTEAGLSPYLRERILSEARVVYERAA